MISEKEIIDACNNLEYYRAGIYKTLDKLITCSSIVNNLPDLPSNKRLIKSTAKFENDIIKIHVDDYLPRTQKINSIISSMWVNSILASIHSLHNIKKWKKTMVYIMVSAPARNWDIDNRGISLIINAIKYSRLIKDDNLCHLAYGYEAKSEEDNFTDIFIFDAMLVHEKLPYIWKTNL